MAEEHDDIMGQIYIAFGQGAGTMRVSRAACAALRGRYYTKIAEAVKDWDNQAAQVLERIRALGRLMAVEAANSGQTVISHEKFVACAEKVESASVRTIYCDVTTTTTTTNSPPGS